MERIVVVVVLWWSGAVHADTCIDRADAVARNDAAKKAAAVSYDKALAGKKLKPIAVPTVAIGSDNDPVTADYKVFVMKDGLLTDLQGSCGGPAAELVQQGTKIFRVERKPRIHVKKVETCQCTYLNIGGCGRPASAHAVGHALPSGTTYAGTITIEYDEDQIQTTHAQACPPPAAIP
jgi:hypothetical protein